MTTVGAVGARGGSSEPGTLGERASDWTGVPCAQCWAHVIWSACPVMPLMQAGCDADVATAAMPGTDMAQTLAANAICCHNNSIATNQNR